MYLSRRGKHARFINRSDKQRMTSIRGKIVFYNTVFVGSTSSTQTNLANKENNLSYHSALQQSLFTPNLARYASLKLLALNIIEYIF